MSIPDLIIKATQDLHNDLASGKMADMPPILSIENIRLQFVTNNVVFGAAGNMTGHFNSSRRIILQTLSKQH